MKVQHIPCGSPANESERKAIAFLMNKLQAVPGDGEWILLTNWLFSITNRVQSDEIDMLLIGPPGVRVIEVKHWDDKWARDHNELVTHEVEKLTGKVKKIATTLRKHEPEVGFVDGCILLTRETSSLKNLRGQPIRGIPFWGLADWKTLIEEKNQTLTGLQVKNLCRMLEPRSAVALEGDLRRFGGLVNLEMMTPPEERFHHL
ncbi:MAG TPA: nuclease-related domain-containing protein [bacterium]|nr:nuclease-related domain-containing protein [bacterium]